MIAKMKIDERTITSVNNYETMMSNVWRLLEEQLDQRNPKWRDKHWLREMWREDSTFMAYFQITAAAADLTPEQPAISHEKWQGPHPDLVIVDEIVDVELM